MRKAVPAASPDAYVATLAGWQRERVETLRAAVRKAAAFQEVVKWGHLVYLANGPVLLIRAEEERVLFGFWRGQRLRSIEPRLKPGGKYRDGDPGDWRRHAGRARRGPAPRQGGRRAQRVDRRSDRGREEQLRDEPMRGGPR